jgi:hypothetical protein
MAFSLSRACRCSHERDAHEHYRRGTDCARCDCVRYRGGVALTVSFRGPTAATVIVPDLVEQSLAPYVRPTHMAGTGGRPAPAPRVAPQWLGPAVATPPHEVAARSQVRQA